MQGCFHFQSSTTQIPLVLNILKRPFDIVSIVRLQPWNLTKSLKYARKSFRSVIISVLLNVVHFVTNLSASDQFVRFKPYLATVNCFLLTSRVKLLTRTWNFWRCLLSNPDRYIFIFLRVHP